MYITNPEKLGKLLMQLLEGMGTSLTIFTATLLLSLPLGLAIAFGRMSKWKIISSLFSVYILIMRGTPLILQLYAVYFFLPKLLAPIVNPLFGPITRLGATIIAFVLNYAAYFAEIYRGGILAVPKGQREAAKVLGFTKGQSFFRIILPQVIKHIMLPVSNEVITLVKDTSLATAIGLGELFLVAKNATNFSGSVEPLFIAGLFYLVMNTVVTVGFHYAMRRMDYYRI